MRVKEESQQEGAPALRALPKRCRVALATALQKPPGWRARSDAPYLRSSAAFTILELLTVMTIIVVLAAIALPSLNSFRPNVGDTAAKQLLGAVGRARQLAISQRTTVYMVFVPTNFFADPALGGTWPPPVSPAGWQPADLATATNLFDKQLVAYNYVSLRSVGDQPGRFTPHYLSTWKTLPDSAFIATWKFGAYGRNLPVLLSTNRLTGSTVSSLPAYWVYGFRWTNNIPFPNETTASLTTGPNGNPAWVSLPYIAFNYLGQLVDGQSQLVNTNEFIPLAKGSVLYTRNASQMAQAAIPTIREMPSGNSTSSFNVVNIDWLTGRARIEHQQFQ
ncbi:conserved hypothetical protein [Verrucomicrobia bacterium]|nr:conserved hypothetical protein [Verrucomicrobiota bacterium]